MSLPGSQFIEGTLSADSTIKPADYIGANCNYGYIINDGTGDIGIQLKNKKSDTLSDSGTLKPAEIFDLNNLDISEIKLIHSGTNADYRMLISR